MWKMNHGSVVFNGTTESIDFSTQTHRIGKLQVMIVHLIGLSMSCWPK